MAPNHTPLRSAHSPGPGWSGCLEYQGTPGKNLHFHSEGRGYINQRCSPIRSRQKGATLTLIIPLHSRELKIPLYTFML